MPIGPNTSLALAFSGILGIYVECLRPGRAIPGCVGAALLLWGGYSLYSYRPTVTGYLLLTLAIFLFSMEAWFNAHFVSGIAATCSLFAGLERLLPPAHRIHFVFALLLSAVLGLITTLLCVSAREARRNKWWDLPAD